MHGSIGRERVEATLCSGVSSLLVAMLRQWCHALDSCAHDRCAPAMAVHQPRSTRAHDSSSSPTGQCRGAAPSPSADGVDGVGFSPEDGHTCLMPPTALPPPSNLISRAPCKKVKCALQSTCSATCNRWMEILLTDLPSFLQTISLRRRPSPARNNALLLATSTYMWFSA
ncbi:hypothetical protein BDA96_05G094900 [Sorghum bicolor]|uniref:Uncharacterized protein n=2 Tax=Sorghum bicolor TaxID=4558 RepID=A0A921QYY8_SORBI|nr:hypothetical protein BDA96_05G094900 [Sorghum bicolor]KXG28156.1 hypothetical protein SORBI_3005G092100 [Sorghum bicolor]